LRNFRKVRSTRTTSTHYISTQDAKDFDGCPNALRVSADTDSDASADLDGLSDFGDDGGGIVVLGGVSDDCCVDDASAAPTTTHGAHISSPTAAADGASVTTCRMWTPSPSRPLRQPECAAPRCLATITDANSMFSWFQHIKESELGRLLGQALESNPMDWRVFSACTGQFSEGYSYKVPL